jgi:hypothetical protein
MAVGERANGLQNSRVAGVHFSVSLCPWLGNKIVPNAEINVDSPNKTDDPNLGFYRDFGLALSSRFDFNLIVIFFLGRALTTSRCIETYNIFVMGYLLFDNALS